MILHCEKGVWQGVRLVADGRLAYFSHTSITDRRFATAGRVQTPPAARKTPSDYRSGLNSSADMANRCFWLCKKTLLNKTF